MIPQRNIRTALLVFACILGGTFRADAQATLSGRVTDQHDNGVADAQLSFFDDGRRFALVTTDAMQSMLKRFVKSWAGNPGNLLAVVCVKQ